MFKFRLKGNAIFLHSHESGTVILDIKDGAYVLIEDVDVMKM